MFTQSAFTKKNTPELREKLEKLGYIQNEKDENLGTCICTGIYGNYSTVNVNEGTYSFGSDKEDVDCGTNEALFLAIAALRDDSDKYQWFYNEFGEWDLCKVDHLKFSDTHINGQRVWHKATVAELINHFK